MDGMPMALALCGVSVVPSVRGKNMDVLDWSAEWWLQRKSAEKWKVALFALVGCVVLLSSWFHQHWTAGKFAGRLQEHNRHQPTSADDVAAWTERAVKLAKQVEPDAIIRR